MPGTLDSPCPASDRLEPDVISSTQARSVDPADPTPGEPEYATANPYHRHTTGPTTSATIRDTYSSEAPSAIDYRQAVDTCFAQHDPE